MSATLLELEVETPPEEAEEESHEAEIGPVVLRFAPILRRISKEDFFQFCAINNSWKLELTKEGDLIIMMPAGGETGRSNFKLIGAFHAWVEADGTGEGFDSNTGFILPNGAERSPDMAWVRKERWEALSQKQREEFVPLCPDFVVELRSRTDRLKPLQEKMEEYIANGAELGWLIDPRKRKVYIYRPNAPVEILVEPERLRGEPLLKGLVMPVEKLWRK